MGLKDILRVFTRSKRGRYTFKFPHRQNKSKSSGTRDETKSGYNFESPLIFDPEYSIEKSKIYYHRSYRKLEEHNMWYVLFSMLLQVIVVNIVILIFYSRITFFICRISRSILSSCISVELMQMVPKPYIYENVSILVLPGRYPTIKITVIVAIVSLTLLFLALSVKRAIEPKWVWIIFISFINLVAAFFFLFFPSYFPYDLEFFSEIYIKTEVGLWMAIPFILTIAFLPLPLRMPRKLLVIVLTILYSIVFACVRYIVFLYLLRTITYLFMALLFFMLGPFLDFIYIVGSYSLCLSHLGRKTKKDVEIWNWLY